MDQESMKRLRFDRRLIRRRGWVSREEVESELETLPDVSDKIDLPEERSAAPSELPETPDSDTPPGSSEPGGF